MHSYRLTGQQVAEIFNVRLRPHLPAYLTKVEPHTYHIRYTFKPFTGREAEPMEPDYKTICDDPKLAHEYWDKEAGRPVADEAEYELREAARHLLSDVYRQARIEWKNARHVADLKATVKNTSDLWKDHTQAKHAVEAAFAYLREPDAAKEWLAAISRLVDAQDIYLKAAIAFDERAQEIAEVHKQHFHEEMLGYDEALAVAGFPEAKDWYIAGSSDYGTFYSGEYSRYTTAGQAQALIKEQEAHVAKVGRLAGQVADA